MTGPSFDRWENERHKAYYGFCLDACDHDECHEATEEADERDPAIYDDENGNEEDET